MTSTFAPPVDQGMYEPTSLEIIQEHVDWMKASEKFSVNTQEDARRVLLACELDLGALATADADELAAWLTAGRDPRTGKPWGRQTKATYRQHLRRFFAWAVEEEWIDWDPSTRLPRPRVPKGVPRPCTDAEADLAVTALPMPFKLHARLARWAGLRCLEVARLHREHVTAKQIYVFGKGDKPAMLPNHPRIWELVESLPSGPVTRKPRSQAGLDHWVSTETAEQLRAIGVAITMHQLRHWFATDLLKTTGNMEYVRRLMRHESMDTTRGYTLVGQTELQDAVLGLTDISDR
jgi:site-specific recombinase XerD